MMADEAYFKASTFEEKYKVLATGKWTPADRKRSAEQLAYMCLCGSCPSYVGTGETQLVFCTIGKSESMPKQRECLCVKCGVTRTMSMRWKYYCTEGSAFELSDLTEE
jgi:hypothetical protein